MYFHPYAIGESTPLFPFGYGLSYTRYVYSNLEISKDTIPDNGEVTVSVDVENCGTRDGEEIVQLYIRDVYSSATRPVKELKDFRRIKLAKGKKKRVDFTLPASKLAFYNDCMEWVVEPGEYKIMVGGSSLDEDLLTINLNVE